jgi:hypothetical protein
MLHLAYHRLSHEGGVENSGMMMKSQLGIPHPIHAKAGTSPALETKTKIISIGS